MSARVGRRGVALVAALLVALALAALLLARSAGQLLHVEALAAERRALHAAADADSALAWRLAAEVAAPGAPTGGPLPAPLAGRAWRAPDPRGVRIGIEVVRDGATARREALLPAAPEAPRPAPP